jgi:hypothetical protein
VIKKLVLGRAPSLRLKSTEAADKVVPSIISLVVDTFISVRKLLEKSNRHLKA